MNSVSAASNDPLPRSFVLSEETSAKHLRTARMNKPMVENSRQHKRQYDDTSYHHDDDDNVVTDDIARIQKFWGNLRPYKDNPSNVFGVVDVGLPDGCQVEQAHVLHRHAARYPASAEIANLLIFANKVKASKGPFTGVLSFLNKWSFQLGQDLLLPAGASMEYASGVDFWDKYGRTLYNASAGQPFYNPANQVTPLLRCNNIPRVMDSARAWADGYFGEYNQTQKYNLLVIPAAPGVNNTLSSYLACNNFLNTNLYPFNIATTLYNPIGLYLQNAVARLSKYCPRDVNLTVLDAFSMQALCTYETVTFGSSDFCGLFTLTEWRGFRYAYDLFLYNGFSFGSPFGRSLGLGTLEELIARLKGQTISKSDSSVNSTLDGSTSTFPLGQKFYLDMTHDFMIVGTLTALSLDYFHQPSKCSTFPPSKDCHFISSYIVPYAARLITEKIGCNSPNPTASHTAHTSVTPTQFGYSPSNATYKFVRMRLNNGILPLATIRGGLCAGRTDGLCPLSKFLASQTNASAEANYPLCFGNFTYNANKFNDDGNYFV